MLGTLSSSSGRSNDITSAFCSASTFCGRVERSATVCTNVTRAFWYCSNTCSTARDIVPDQTLFLSPPLSLAVACPLTSPSGFDRLLCRELKPFQPSNSAGAAQRSGSFSVGIVGLVGPPSSQNKKPLVGQLELRAGFESSGSTDAGDPFFNLTLKISLQGQH